MSKDNGQLEESPAAASHPGQSGGMDNIEQIRHLLFGPQVKSLENRIQNLDKRLEQEMTAIRDDLRKRLDSLEQYMKSEFSSLLERIEGEREERSTADKQQLGQIKELEESLENRAKTLEDAVRKSAHEIHEQMLRQAKTLTEEAQLLHERALIELHDSAAAIRAEYVDRSLLSSLFTETALRLNNDLARAMVPNSMDIDTPS